MKTPDVIKAIAVNEVSSAHAQALHHSRYLLIDADNAAAWRALGAALARLGNRAGAFTALKNAVLLDGSCAASHIELGKLLFDSGRMEEALGCFECARAHQPQPHRESSADSVHLCGAS